MSVSLDGQGQVIVEHHLRARHSRGCKGLDSLTRKFELLNELLSLPRIGIALQTIVTLTYHTVQTTRFPLIVRSETQVSSFLQLVLELEGLLVPIQVPLNTRSRKVVPCTVQTMSRIVWWKMHGHATPY